jgi:Alginate lyase
VAAITGLSFAISQSERSTPTRSFDVAAYDRARILDAARRYLEESPITITAFTIDTIHLVEVARAIQELEGSTALRKHKVGGIKKWFADYLRWMTTHPYGVEERDICWVMQVAAFARLTGNKNLAAYARNRLEEPRA